MFDEIFSESVKYSYFKSFHNPNATDGIGTDMPERR